MYFKYLQSFETNVWFFCLNQSGFFSYVLDFEGNKITRHAVQCLYRIYSFWNLKLYSLYTRWNIVQFVSPYGNCNKKKQNNLFLKVNERERLKIKICLRKRWQQYVTQSIHVKYKIINRAYNNIVLYLSLSRK